MEEPRLLTKEELIGSFGWEEYLVLSLMLLVSTLIGIYFAWKGQKSNAEYLLGGRRMGVFPVAMSLTATMMSAIGMLGTPSEIYRYGSQFGAIIFAFPLVMYCVTYWYLPVFWKLEVSTSYEYLEWRFNRGVRLLCSALFTIQMVLYMSIVVYAPALAISQVTGFGVDLACGVIMLVCICYTTIGGIKAVMWTDAFQSTMMFGALIAVVIKGTIDAGGITNVIVSNYNSSRIEFFNVDPDVTVPYTMWSVVIGGWFYWLSIYGTNQAMVQRYLSAKDYSTAVCAIWWNCLGISSLHVLYIFVAWIAYAFYNSILTCDPIYTKLIDKQDQIIPLFVAQIMKDVPCITGVFMAGVVSGALSTVSSGLSSLSAIAYQDFIQAGCQVKISEEKSTLMTKALSAGFGVLCYATVYLIKYAPGVMKACLSVFGITGGPLLGIFALGMFFPWANTLGTFIGALCSVIITTWICVGKALAQNFGEFSTDRFLKSSEMDGCPSEFLKNSTSAEADETSFSFIHLSIYEISPMWYTPLSCSICFVIGCLVSIAMKPENIKKLNPDLISPAFFRAFRWFPWLAYLVRQEKHFETKIGEEYIPGPKESNLRKQAIMKHELELTESFFDEK